MEDYCIASKQQDKDNDSFLYIFDDERRVARVNTNLDRSRLLTGFSDSVPADHLSAAQATAERRWYIADHLGGTNLLVDERGAVTAEMVWPVATWTGPR